MEISHSIYPVTFTVLAILGGSGLLLLGVSLAVSWPPSHFAPGQALLLAKIAVVVAVCLLVAFRMRTVTFNEATGVIAVSWGRTLPITYHTYPSSEWGAITVTEYTPVGIMPVGGVMKAYHLEPRFRLDGKTYYGKVVALGTFATKIEANTWATRLNAILEPHNETSGSVAK